ncbi:ribosomal RNA-processing protein 17 [Phalaenopsis equestris]|uniref:ribosomal RNA-processing protein 17 n=1 Tax=Phalaenopsis equestris TaxID=78828 RepID=UPI0009E4AE49|nr:ribosomal RNA-processing protein 17 [Phalaenopsis equestris]
MDDEQEFDEGVVVGQRPTVMVPRHINKKSLRNRGLSIAFDEKNLRDFITGFQKRKDKRRKEAQKQLHEKERQMRIMARKKRKEAKELALKGQLKEPDSDLEQDAENDAEDGSTTIPSVSATKTYENTNTTITVTTSEIVNENDGLEPVDTVAKLGNKLEKNHKLPVKRRPMKGLAKRRKLQKKTSKKFASRGKDGRKNKNK